VDGVGHSEGGFTLTIAAYLQPQHFRNLIFINPAGTTQLHPAQLVMRYGRDMSSSIKNLNHETGTTKQLNINSGPKVMIQNPIATIQGIQAIAQADNREMWDTLRTQGVKIAIIQGTCDVFPMEGVQANIKKHHVDAF